MAVIPFGALVAVCRHVSSGIIGAHLAPSAAEIATTHRPLPLLPGPPGPALLPNCRGNSLWPHAWSRLALGALRSPRLMPTLFIKLTSILG